MIGIGTFWITDMDERACFSLALGGQQHSVQVNGVGLWIMYLAEMGVSRSSIFGRD